jgi:regulatory protein
MNHQWKKAALTDRQAALSLALKTLSRRALSQQELIRKLKTRGCPEEIISELVMYLLQRRYLDDVALANYLFTSMMQSGKCGVNKIKNKLRQRGIAENIIENLLQTIEENNEIEIALNLVRKKFTYYDSDNIDKPKVYRFLINRGFSLDVIYRVLNCLESETS